MHYFLNAVIYKLGYQIITESDCSRIISSINSPSVDRSEIGQILEDAKGFALLFNDWKTS